jgi:hypothetical protein
MLLHVRTCASCLLVRSVLSRYQLLNILLHEIAAWDQNSCAHAAYLFYTPKSPNQLLILKNLEVTHAIWKKSSRIACISCCCAEKFDSHMFYVLYVAHGFDTVGTCIAVARLCMHHNTYCFDVLGRL